MGARPFTLRCSKCKKFEDYKLLNRPSGNELYRTGKEKVAKTYGRRHQVQMWEVHHKKCGHTFWTDHCDAKRKPLLEA